MALPFPRQELAELEDIARAVTVAIERAQRGGRPRWPEIHAKLVEADGAVHNRILVLMRELGEKEEGAPPD